MKKRNKVKNYKFLLALIFLLLIIVAYSSIILYYLLFGPIETRVLEVKFIVGENVGMDLNNTALTFGRIVPGGFSERKIFIENTKEFSIEAKIFATKDILDYLEIENNTFVIKPLQTLPINIKVNIPIDAKLGEYNGKILIKIYKIK